MPSNAARVREAAATNRDALAPLIRVGQKRFKIPAMSIPMVRGNDLLWSDGSVSLAKPLTAIAVMQLAQQVSGDGPESWGHKVS